MSEEPIEITLTAEQVEESIELLASVMYFLVGFRLNPHLTQEDAEVIQHRADTIEAFLHKIRPEDFL